MTKTQGKLAIAGGAAAALGLLTWALWPQPLGPTTRTKRSIVAYRIDPDNIWATQEAVTIPMGAQIEILGPDNNGDVHFVWNNQNYRTAPSSLS
jgi:hypothetical protein